MRFSCIVAAIFACLLVLASAASAAPTLCGPGTGSGQCASPRGLGVNTTTGRVYLGDQDNHRVDVFGPLGFEKTFGWGVQDGGGSFQFCAVSCRAGLPGAGSGQFEGPTDLAVDNFAASPSQGAVYVVDMRNYRIEKFDEDGNFLLTFGGGVNKTKVAEAAPKAQQNLCTAASGDLCGKGANSQGEGEFAAAAVETIGIHVGVGPGGTVYVLDALVGGVKPKVRVQRFQPNGTPIAPQQVLQPENFVAEAFAVDSTGDFYAATETIRKYEVGSPEPIATIPAGGGGRALAVGPGDHLFEASNSEGPGVKRSVAEYDAAGNTVRRFGYGAFVRFVVGGLAADKEATGVYASDTEANKVLHLGFPEPGPIVLPEPCTFEAGTLGNTRATLVAAVNPEGEATTYHFEYVDQATFAADQPNGFAHASKTPESASIGTDFHLHEASAALTGLAPETEYHCRVVAANASDPEVSGEAGSFKTKQPIEFGPAWASEVKADSAVLSAEVNPLGIEANAQFEYVSDAQYQLDQPNGYAQAALAPPVPIDFTGETMQLGAAALSGLAPGTLYHYRLRAKNGFPPAGLVDPERPEGRTFRTPRPLPPGLPDARAYELVSPAQKNSGEAGVPGPGVGGLSTFDEYNFIEAAAGSGEALTYTSWTSFAEPQGAPPTNQYISRRAGGGWQTVNPSPSGSQKLFLPSFRGFSADLRYGAMVASLPQAEGATPGFDNLYLRDNESGALRVLTVGAPNVQSPELCLDYAGVSADGSRAFFAARGAYAGAPQGDGSSLYEWSAAQGLKVLSILPSGTAAAPFNQSGFGTGADCQTGIGVARHVVSSDGSRAFWTYAPTGGPTQLLVRINGTETAQLDKKVTGGSGEPGNGLFWAASATGAKSFFTSESKLTAGSGAVSGKPDLYQYELPGKKLTDLSAAASPADVEGVVGVSDDGAYVYFVATGALAPGAAAGEHNLYLYHEGATVLVAALAGADDRAWERTPRVQTARVSPDGRHLAFLSVEAESLAGYDNTIVAGAHCQLEDPLHAPFKGEALIGSPLCPQAFVYDAASGDLSCASCNPSGARPLGPTILPGASNPYEGMRYLSDDGSRLFFETLDALVVGDENAKRDVYEFERPASGSCSPASPSFSPEAGGCHFLLSTGKSSDESYLVDASSSGRDIFFATREPLVGWDLNPHYDIYDARAGGGFPEPSSPAVCMSSDTCKAPATPPPPPPAVATPDFTGAGNVKPSKPRNKHKSKKHKKHKSKHGKGSRR